MKTLEKKFDAVQFMRQQRDRLNEILLPMSKEEIVAYFKQREKTNTVRPSAAATAATASSTILAKEMMASNSSNNGTA